MKKPTYVTIRMTQDDAYKRGLLICKCGFPKNKHFGFWPFNCAHSRICKGYDEIARYGELVEDKE